MPLCHFKITYPKPRPWSYPQSPQHIGEHIKKRRLDLGLLQHEAAEEMSVSPWTVINWESGETMPPVWYGTRIIKFLGSDPMPEPESFAGRVWSLRWRLGLKQWELAEKLGVNQGTVSDWERGRCRPSRELRERFEESRDKLPIQRDRG